MRFMLTGSFLFALAALSSAVSAQEAPGATVRVAIAVWPPLLGPSAVVVLEDTANPGERREITLGRTLAASFGSLRPATYRLRIDVPGGEPALADVRVDAHEIVTLAATIGPAGQDRSLVRVAHRRREAEGAYLDRESLGALPAATDLWALIETSAPFVVVDRMDTGGVGLGRSALMGSRGESWTTTAVDFGGALVKDAGRTGRLPFLPDLNAVEAVGVTSGLASAAVQTPGVHVWLTARRPGAQLRGGIDASWSGPELVATNARPDAPSIARVESWRGIGLFAGGPIGRRAGLFLSTSAAATRQQERARTERVRSSAATVFAHLVSAFGDRDQMRVLVDTGRVRHPYDGRAQFDRYDVAERGRAARAQLAWERHGLNGSRRVLSVGGERSQSIPQVSTEESGGTVDRVIDGVVPASAASVHRSGWNLGIGIERPVRRFARMLHSPLAGVSVRSTRESSSLSAFPTVAESVDGLPARVWQPVAPLVSSRRGMTELGAYVSDRITAGSALTLNLGARADLIYGSARGAAQGISWRALSPRVSFEWSPAAVAVFGGYGRYVASTALSLVSFGDPGETRSEVRRWTDANRDGRYDAGEAGVLVAHRGRHASIAGIDPGLAAPATDEWTIGGELRQGAYSTLRGAIIIRRQDNLVGSVNTGVPLSSYRTFSVFDVNSDEGSPHDDQMLEIYDRLPASFGLDQFLLTNPEGARSKYEGIELSWLFRSPRWHVLFGATTYRASGSGGDAGAGPLENDPLVIGERYAQPNASSKAPGRLFFDRAYVGKWSTTYRAPRDVLLAAVVRYQDGQPFTRFVIAPDLAGGPEVIEAYPLGKTRFTFTATIDVRLEKGITVGGRRGALRLDIFNLTNHANEVEEDVVTGPLFRRSTAVQPPRTLRVGVRFDF